MQITTAEGALKRLSGGHATWPPEFLFSGYSSMCLSRNHVLGKRNKVLLTEGLRLKGYVCHSVMPEDRQKQNVGSGMPRSQRSAPLPNPCHPPPLFGSQARRFVPGLERSGIRRLLKLEAPHGSQHAGRRQARKGSVKKRTQLKNPLTRTSIKRNKNGGQFMAVKKTAKEVQGRPLRTIVGKVFAFAITLPCSLRFLCG
jgi:hypothetical protein